MWSRSTTLVRRVEGKSRHVLKLGGLSSGKRHISVSVTSARDAETVERTLSAARRSCKQLHINVTDFGLKSDVMEQIALLRKHVNMRECTVIVSAANSIDDPLGRIERIFDACGADKPASVMVVKGSTGPALDASEGMQKKLKAAYTGLCKFTRDAGVPLTLVSDITESPQYVMDDLIYKMEGLGADIISTHPLVDPSLVSPMTREFLKRYLHKVGGRIILGQLRHTEILYRDYTRDEPQAPKVDKFGRDRYLVSDMFKDCAGAGAWDEATLVATVASKMLSRQIQPGRDFSQSTQTRIGLKVGAEDLAFMANLIECDDTDITEAVHRMLARTTGGNFTTAEATALTRRLTFGTPPVTM